VRARKTEIRPDREPQDKNAARRIGGLARWSVPLCGFRLLMKLRGKFSESVRHFAVYYFAVLLRKNRASESAIRRECDTLALLCSPALDDYEVRRCIESSKRARYPVSNSTLARDLKITLEEKAALPEWFRPCAVRLTQSQRNRQYAARVSRRRALISELLS